jgi:hypothetical protein
LTSTPSRSRGAAARDRVGSETPRLWTRPLRPLTPETSLGFEVIEFAETFLKVELYPWQKWLLIHALELLEDGSYRFKRVIVLVARQQGKTMLASVLAAWWVFVDSDRFADRVPPFRFKVVGVAQNLDIAREPWAAVKLWCDPNPETDEDRDLAIPALQSATAKVVDTNGKEAILARSRAHYEIRAAKNARGKPAARVLMDELREQRDWLAWNAVSQVTKAFWNGMLIGFSNAGDPGAVVLRQQRDAGIADIAEWDEYVSAGILSAEEYANSHDVSLALFEWSAPEGCAKDDIDGILQANPSIGHGAMTVESAIADIRGMTDAGYRTEVLCQWVSANVDSFIDVKDWTPLRLGRDEFRIPKGARTVWGVDTSHDRSMTWLGAAVFTEDGRPFSTVWHRRAGMLWLPDYVADLALESGSGEVVLQGSGCAAVEFIEPLQERGLTVHALPGGVFAIATGRMRDRVREGRLALVDQPDVNIAVEGGVVKDYGENLAWSRSRSLPVDISGLVAMTVALYGLEVLTPPERVVPPPPPPRAAILTAGDDDEDAEVNLATVRF